MSPSESDKAYTAAIIDGEGCISLWRTNRNSIELQITVVMRGEPVILWLQQMYGGGTYSQGKCLKWVLPWDSQEQFLKGILPYLKLKDKQAAIALAYLETRTGVSGKRIDDRTRLVREYLCDLMTEEKDRWRETENANEVPVGREV